MSSSESTYCDASRDSCYFYKAGCMYISLQVCQQTLMFLQRPQVCNYWKTYKLVSLHHSCSSCYKFYHISCFFRKCLTHHIISYDLLLMCIFPYEMMTNFLSSFTNQEFKAPFIFDALVQSKDDLRPIWKSNVNLDLISIQIL